MSPDDRVRLGHILGAIDSASRFIAGRRRDDLDTDQMLVFALVRAVEIVGEAAAKVSAEGRAELPDVRWSSIVGMRNRLIHGYFAVDLDILWQTVTGALATLETQIRQVVPDLEGDLP
jgi:uncharacterized protein with HEPN domain